MRLLVTLCVLAAAQVASAVDHAAALKDYLTDDVVAVAYVDLSKLDVVGTVEWVDEVAERETDYYYVRVTQGDGAMAWTSPVWVSVK